MCPKPLFGENTNRKSKMCSKLLIFIYLVAVCSTEKYNSGTKFIVVDEGINPDFYNSREIVEDAELPIFNSSEKVNDLKHDNRRNNENIYLLDYSQSEEEIKSSEHIQGNENIQRYKHIQSDEYEHKRRDEQIKSNGHVENNFITTRLDQRNEHDKKNVKAKQHKPARNKHPNPLYGIIKQMPKDGELHIHTKITFRDKAIQKTENHYFACPDSTGKLCHTSSSLIKNIKSRKSEDPHINKNNFRTISKTLKDLMQQEYQQMFGSNITLSEEEAKVNNVIMKHKTKILNEHHRGSKAFHPQHFFDIKDSVKETQLYKIIKDMPKGAALYAHDIGLLGPDYLLKITYQPHLYVCFQKNVPAFRFLQTLPDIPCETLWLRMDEARRASNDAKRFDARLRKHFTLVMGNPKGQSNYIDIVLSKYRKYFSIVRPLLSFQSVWETYFYDALKAYRNDKIMYLEIRSSLPLLYDLDGNVYDPIHTAETYKKVLDEFVRDYPDFYGAKLIYSPRALSSKESLEKALSTARKLKEILPDFFAGLDLIGQEVKGKPLKYFKSDLQKPINDFNYFYHARKSSSHGWTEEDLFDAVSLPVKRIGHAFAVVKHPLLIDELKKKDICLEVNLVSNMVLSALDDVRDHPLAEFLAYNLPVVLSSYAPGIWEADPMTHDFYVTFVEVAGKKADLKVLKKLAMNSITYSEGNDKKEMFKRFLEQWDEFIRKVET